MGNTALFTIEQSFYLKIADAFDELRRGIWKVLLVVILSWFIRLDWPSILTLWGFLAYLSFSFKTQVIFTCDGIYSEIGHWILLGRKSRHLIANWWQVNAWEIIEIGTRPMLLIDTTHGALRLCPAGAREQARQRIEEAIHVLSEQYRKNIL
ncbi:MAG TPA: hypothetical protein VFB21_03075 [Chthonomonadaceae bacterium]|nr:hypothetical protein [Chthonomonadaceae bacterium]